MMIFLLFCYFIAVQSLPQGAPPRSCHNMFPVHRGIARQNDPSPFEVSTAKRNGGVFVIVKSGFEIPFKGFMLQARTPSRELIGTFEPTGDGMHVLTCDNPGDSLTHSDASREQSSVQVQWQPNGYEGPVIFK